MEMRNSSYSIRRGDIFNIDLGEFGKLGSEQRGERPCIIVSNNTGNRNSNILLVIPLTSQMTKAKLPTHVLLENEFGLRSVSVAMAEQSIVISKDRIKNYIGKIKKSTMGLIDEATLVAFGLKDNKYIQEVKKQVEEVKYHERNMNESKEDDMPKYLIVKRILNFEKALNELINICDECRVDINEYYNSKESLNLIAGAKENLQRQVSTLIAL